MTIFLQIIVSALSIGAMYGLAALGLTLMFKITGALNIAFGSVIMIVGLMLWSLEDRGYTNRFTSLLIGPALGALVMFVIHIIVIRPMLPRGHLTIVVVTLGIDVILAGVALVRWGPDSKVLDPQAHGQFRVTNVVVQYQKLFICVLVAAITVAAYLFFRRTLHGKAMLAAAEEGEGVTAVGIVASRMQCAAVVVSGVIAGLAAAVMIPVITVNPNFGGTIALTIVIAMVLGGMGSLPGAIIGGIVLGAVQGWSVVYAPAWSDVLQFAILLGVMGARGMQHGRPSLLHQAHRLNLGRSPS